jgi:hypothetical protein
MGQKISNFPIFLKLSQKISNFFQNLNFCHMVIRKLSIEFKLELLAIFELQLNEYYRFMLLHFWIKIRF